jgi:hypothetical protein
MIVDLPPPGRIKKFTVAAWVAPAIPALVPLIGGQYDRVWEGKDEICYMSDKSRGVVAR